MPADDEQTESTATAEHGQPADGMMCLATMEDITYDNYVEYKAEPSGKWKPCLYEQSVVEQLLQTQFQAFVDRVKTTDCQAELRRLLTAGPPVYVSDKHALPLDDDETHVSTLWFSSTNTERTAKLDGALEGEERRLLWEDLRQFIIVEGKEPGDDDDDDDDDDDEDENVATQKKYH